jgi:WD40 repeat protein
VSYFVHTTNVVKWKQSIFQAKFKAPLYKVRWNSKNQLLSGTSDGCIAIWCVDDFLYGRKMVDRESFCNPERYFGMSNFPIINLDWYMDDYIITATIKGRVQACNIHEPDSKLNVLVSNGISQFILVLITSLQVFDGQLYINHTDNKVCMIEVDDFVKQIGSVNSKAVFGSTSACWDVDYSPFYDFVAGSTADGAVNLFNLQKLNQRGKKAYALLYKVFLDPSKTLCFKLDKKSTKFTHERAKFEIPDPYVGIHCISWNKGLLTKQFICTGGVGWIRSDVAH